MGENEIKLGDVVRLKSGGMPMTVTYIDRGENQAVCRWQHPVSKDICREKIETYALEKCPPEESADKK